ncbi:MAG: FHA domain-containing protein [Chitinophagales bacterium]
MAKVQCYNCKKTTPVVAPRYRCKYCNYPLNKYVEQEEEPEEEIIIERLKQEIPDEMSIHDKYLLDKASKEEKDINQILDNLKPDEKVQKTMTGPVIIKKNLNPEKDGKIIAGWLVVHTEGRLPVTYELFEGANVIGRPDGPHHVDIRVEDDEYVSRIHSIITVKKDYLHRFYYELADNGKLRRGNPSTNGTYINGQSERLPKNNVVHLRDNDTVQVGTTKLVFKNIDNSDNLESAAHSVIETDFTSTVAIR